ncbi:BMP family ABC transporter substrate-binding protein [Aneurinibacillus terranovensis]|uniref:BMP family ABC transporter substrate-binding protein n=1 Tax=Aneurinibacillus terranovensis TaxID=278991 RepID=UPI0004834006|nr:BMP family ABC transporter substrate-binding protein [Aneurinibacillus terranovensis]
MKKLWLFLVLSLLTGCSSLFHVNQSKQETPFRVALLVEGSIYDQGWDEQAYLGLKQIERTMGAQTSYLEYINTTSLRRKSVETFAKQGYSLIFGNGRGFEKTFNELAVQYPATHFVFFNGHPSGPNVSAVNFTPESLGYFSGMAAALMTKSHVIGLIPAFGDLKEIQPFIMAAKAQNPKNRIMIQSVNDWNNRMKAGCIARKMIKGGADILVPMGDGFSIQVIMEAHNANALAIGYISDQSFVSKKTVITSTIQQVSKLYLEVAKEYKTHTLRSGSLYFDFKDGVQELAPFGPMVPSQVQRKLFYEIQRYKEGTFVLPVQRNIE